MIPTLSEESTFGRIEYCGNGTIRGWAIDKNAPELSLDIVVSEGNTEVARLVADRHRCDLLDENLGAGRYGFMFQVPERFENGLVHYLHFRIASNHVELENSPVLYQHLPEADQAVFKTTSLTGNKVLVLAPHPDDETFGAGGSIALHKQSGDEVMVVFMTDGGAGIPGKSRSEAVNIRQTEAKAALKFLGVSCSDLVFFETADRCLYSDSSAVSKLEALFKRFRPTLIYAPSPMEFHPDHKATAQHLFFALQNSGYKGRVALYEVNRPFNPNCLVDITSVLKKKEKAAGEYASQQALYPYWESILGLNRFRALTVAPDCLAAEAFVVLDGEQFSPMTADLFFRQQLLPVSVENDVPLVSVVIRTRNRLRTLQEAIACVVGQTYPNLELVVVNDGGQDISGIIDRFSKLLRVKHVRSREHIGRSAAGNLGFESCTGLYICLLDDDDLWQSNHVQKLADFLTYTGAAFAYSDCERLTYSFEAGEMREVKRESPFFGLEYDRTRLYAGNFVSVISAMFTRELLDKVGGFDADLDYFEDWDLWIRMSWHASFHRLPGITCVYRVFEEHPFDAVAATLKVMRKNARDWGTDSYQKYAWHVVSVLRDENEKLRQRLNSAASDESLVNSNERIVLERCRQLEEEALELRKQVEQMCIELTNTQEDGWNLLGRSLKRFVPASIRARIGPVLKKLVSTIS